MRHVTDGELHTYLDGALDLLPKGRGGEIREHLESCPVCRERLQDEEKIRAQAQSLLGASAPREAALPPFEELRVRAEAAERGEGERGATGQVGAPRYRGPLRGPSLAWAATIVLALGVGWMGGEVWRTGPDEMAQEYMMPETLAEPASDIEIPEMASAPAAVGRGVEAEEVRMEEVLQAEPEAAAGEGAVDLESKSARAQPTPAEPTSSIPEGIAADTEFEDPPAVPGLGLPSVEGLARDEELENPLAVPGLELLSVGWEEWIPGERGLQIRQLLPMGDTLELRYLGLLMGADPETPEESRERSGLSDAASRLPQGMEASLPPGWNQVVMKKERGLLVARAPRSEAYLRALLRSLQ